MDKIISSNIINQNYRKIKHSSGLDIMLCPMEDFSTAYALFGAKVGSTDVTFKTEKEDDFVTVPEGIAHYLEHKMFESLEGDTFAQYAKTGAAANAFTGFDKTAYLFSCTDNFDESLRILLKQVTTPHFTKENVEKEQGIIAQEIQMYDDNPGWRIMFNLLGAMYHENPVKSDIAGTVESIAEIDVDLLYRCYNTFYNLNNMALVICGNFNQDSALKIIDELIQPAEKITVSTKSFPEPREIVKKVVEQNFPISVPMFNIGFKIQPASCAENTKKQIIGEILLDILCGESSDLFCKLYDAGMINGSLSFEIMSGRDYICGFIDGEGRKPQEVYDAICQKTTELQKTGVDNDDFLRCKKSSYGRYVSAYCKPESIAHFILSSHFSDLENVFVPLEIVSSITVEDVNNFLKNEFLTEHSCISIINPINTDD